MKRFNQVIFILVILHLLLLMGCPKPNPNPDPNWEYKTICIDSEKLATQYCPNTEVRRYRKGEGPTIFCDIHKAPEYVNIEVCKESGLLPNKYCPQTEVRQFEKGKEPTAICTIHHKTKLFNKLILSNLNFAFSPFFPKDILISTDRNITEEQARRIMAEIARYDYANILKTFLTYAGYESEHKHPHPKVNEEQWNIRVINNDWWAQVLRRMDYATDLGLTIILILNDQTSFNRWHKHWVCIENNTGFPNVGNETYHDHYGGTKWVNHWNNPSIEPWERERYANTRLYFLWFYEKVLPAMLARYGDKLIIEFNEIDAGDYYHYIHWKDIFEPYGYKKKQLITCVRGIEWPCNKLSIRNFYFTECHGIIDINTYDYWMNFYHSGCPTNGQVFEPYYAKMYISDDGRGPKKLTLTEQEEDLRLLQKVLNDGQKGFIRNNWFKGSFNWDELGWDYGRKMRDAIVKYFNIHYN